jgi:molybdenum cofactor cytidylyltransferase
VPPDVAAVILAAGRSRRFGSAKLAAELEGRPLIRHVVDTAVAAGLEPLVVVVGPDESLATVDLSPARPVTNPNPDEGLSSSVRIGLAALAVEPAVTGAVILLGDQPRVRVTTIRALLDARTTAPLVAPAYADDDAPNPVLARREAWRLADELVGDRGFSPLLASHPELVRRVPVPGANPDVDAPADLARLSSATREPTRE